MAILYSFRRCPYAMRARMALSISGLEYEHREVLLRDKPASMLSYSPKGTVPVFICENGRIIDESLDIMLYALEQNDPQGWLETDRDKSLKLIEIIALRFKPHLDRYKYASRYNEGATRKTIDIQHREAACQILENFEKMLSSRRYLMGEDPTLADYAIFPFIRQFANVEPEWWNTPQFARLHTWLSTLVTSNVFTGIMTKHNVWQEDE